MTSLETFKEILIECGVSVPEEQIEVFRDLIDAQADLILDSWLKSKHDGCDSVK
ncbi:hypothetical protein KC865_01345 [Candidatus Kaiserbacteria bacterium]|nr:hypothetical protein [Candidatus Kaiserbacteria bacterium]USN92650.1 MAG: hypothetical protein H6782_02450 [Candidatus Nomurabacteria bacterium]